MNGGVMSPFKALRGVGGCVGAGVAMTLLGVMASGALAASSVSLCVSSKKGVPVTSGECPANTKGVTYTPVALPSEPGEQQTLISILPYIKFANEGVGGKPTIQISGANLQIVSGSGKSNGPVNGAGNLIIGYADQANCTEVVLCPPPPALHTGSHNLVLGTSQSYTSWGAILGGVGNTASGRNSFVVGHEDTASGIWSSVSGGSFNKASGIGASVSAGFDNVASGERSSVSGGEENQATEGFASVSGGLINTAGQFASISGGQGNKAAEGGAIVGGFENLADGELSTVSGGERNTASGEVASVSGGQRNTASEIQSTVSGGQRNTASGKASTVSGGERNTASESWSAILGGKEVTVSEPWGHFP
jgi:hypothetical protein